MSMHDWWWSWSYNRDRRRAGRARGILLRAHASSNAAPSRWVRTLHIKYMVMSSDIWSNRIYNGQYSRGPDSVPKISIRFRYMVNHLQGKILLDKTKEITVNLISDMQCTVRMCTALYRHDRRTTDGGTSSTPPLSLLCLSLSRYIHRKT